MKDEGPKILGDQWHYRFLRPCGPRPPNLPISIEGRRWVEIELLSPSFHWSDLGTAALHTFLRRLFFDWVASTCQGHGKVRFWPSLKFLTTHRGNPTGATQRGNPIGATLPGQPNRGNPTGANQPGQLFQNTQKMQSWKMKQVDQGPTLTHAMLFMLFWFLPI